MRILSTLPCSSAVCALVIALFCWSTSAEAADLFWNDARGIHRNENADPPAPKLLYNTFETRGIAVAGDRLVWSDVLPILGPFPGGVILTGSTSGGEIDGIARMLPAPSGVAIDAARRRVYWTDLGDGQNPSAVYSANLDGSDARRIISGMSLSEIEGIAIDPARDKLYFSYINPLIDALYTGGIAQADLDGSNLRQVISGLAKPLGLAIDPAGNEVFWADAGFGEGQGVIQAADLANRERRTILGGLGLPFGVALDLAEKNVYWTDNVAGKIQRTAMPGVLPFFEDVITGLSAPTAIAIRNERLAGPTWDVDADGKWSTPANWDGRVPDVTGDRAIFGGVITAPRTVTVDRPVTVGRIDFSNAQPYTIAISEGAADDGPNGITLDVTSGDALIQVHRGSHAISAPLFFSDNTVVTVFDPSGKLSIAGSLGNARVSVTKAGAGMLEVSSIRAQSLALNGGMLAVRGSPDSARGTSVLGSLAIAGDLSSPLATLDVTTSGVVIDYSDGEQNPTSDIRQLILSGRGGPGLDKRWNGTGITSSQVQDDVAANPNITSVAYADNAKLPLGPFTTFLGEPVDKTAVLIGYTRTGDANLDGVVDDDDVTIVGANYAPGKPQPSWALGDFDYNGFVDDDDVTLLGAFYDPKARPVPTPAGGVSAVPEPGTVLLLAAGLIAVAVRRVVFRKAR